MNKAKMRSSSIRSIIARPLFLFLILVWILLCVFTYSRMSSIIEKKTREGVLYGLSQRMFNLNNRLDEMKNSLGSITSVLMDETWSYLHNTSYYRRRISKERIDDVLNSQSARYGDICIFLDKGSPRFLGGSDYMWQTDIETVISALKPFASKEGYTIYHPVEWNKKHRLMMSFDFQTGTYNKRMTVMAAVLSDESVDEMLNVTLPETDSNPLLSGQVYLTDDQGTILDYPTNRKVNCIHVITEPNEYGLCLYYEIPRSIYYAQRYSELLKMTVIMAAGLAAAILIARIISAKIRRPVQYIADTVSSLKLGIPFDVSSLKYTGITEYDLILQHIIEADQRIGNAMKAVLSLEREKQEKDIMLLRMQINPHFLYNALNAVQWMARSSDGQSIDEYMRSLLYILHYNLDDHEDALVPISDEIDLVRAYVMLHQTRYENNIEFRIINHVEQQILLPRFILQPLVENAIYHGLRNGDGIIELEIEKTEDSFLISVRDNGTGISADVLDSIHVGKKQGMGIGIRYVQAILKENDGRLQISNIEKSGVVCGTEARIILKNNTVPTH